MWCPCPHPQPCCPLSAKLGALCPSPSSCPGKDLRLHSQEPAEIWGQWLSREERKRKRGPPSPLLFSPSISTSLSLWVLNAKGEQRVLFEKARVWDRVGVAGNQPTLPPPPHLSLWLPPTSVISSLNSHAAFHSHTVMGWGGGEADPRVECGEWELVFRRAGFPGRQDSELPT